MMHYNSKPQPISRFRRQVTKTGVGVEKALQQNVFLLPTSSGGLSSFLFG
jgi:hypothetical protein